MHVFFHWKQRHFEVHYSICADPCKNKPKSNRTWLHKLYVYREDRHTNIHTNKQAKKEREPEGKKQRTSHAHTLEQSWTRVFFSGALHERLCSMLSGQCRRGNTFIILKCGLLVSLYSNISYIPHHHLLGIKIWIRFDLRVSLPNTKAVPNTHRISSGVLLFISPPGHTTPQSPHCACGANEETCYPST